MEKEKASAASAVDTFKSIGEQAEKQAALGAVGGKEGLVPNKTVNEAAVLVQQQIAGAANVDDVAYAFAAKAMEEKDPRNVEKVVINSPTQFKLVLDNHSFVIVKKGNSTVDRFIAEHPYSLAHRVEIVGKPETQEERELRELYAEEHAKEIAIEVARISKLSPEERAKELKAKREEATKQAALAQALEDATATLKK